VPAKCLRPALAELRCFFAGDGLSRSAAPERGLVLPNAEVFTKRWYRWETKGHPDDPTAISLTMIADDGSTALSAETNVPALHLHISADCRWSLTRVQAHSRMLELDPMLEDIRVIAHTTVRDFSSVSVESISLTSAFEVQDIK